MRVLGLDASSAVTGWAVIETNGINNEDQLIAYGEIHLSKLKKLNFPLEYIKVLHDTIINIINGYKIDSVYIEDIYSRNAVTYKALARIRGICETAIINAQLKNIHPVPSVTVRKTVLNDGSLKKPEICTILESRFGQSLATEGYDQSDAILVALCGAILNNEQPKKKRRSNKRRPGVTKSRNASSKTTK